MGKSDAASPDRSVLSSNRTLVRSQMTQPLTVESVKRVLDACIYDPAPDYSDPDKWYWNAWVDAINTEALAKRIVEAHQ